MVYLIIVIAGFITVCTWFYFDLLDNEVKCYYEDEFIEPDTVHREFEEDKDKSNIIEYDFEEHK